MGKMQQVVLENKSFISWSTTHQAAGKCASKMPLSMRENGLKIFVLKRERRKKVSKREFNFLLYNTVGNQFMRRGPN